MHRCVSAVAGIAAVLAMVAIREAQAEDTAALVKRGHSLAAEICGNCHVAAPDQPYAPIMQPPAPPFALLAQRPDLTADRLKTFLATTHRDVQSPQGMPNPMLMDFQIDEVTAYILSLRAVR